MKTGYCQYHCLDFNRIYDLLRNFLKKLSFL